MKSSLIIGGGVAALRDIRELLALEGLPGCQSDQAVRDPELIRQAAARFGREKLVVSH